MRTQTQINDLLNAFMKDWTGERASYFGYLGECLSLVKKWFDKVDGSSNKAPSAGGWGDYYWSRMPEALKKHWTPEPYVKGRNYPRGSLIVYPATHHIAIFLKDNGDGTHQVFQQNADPDGSAAKTANRPNSKAGGICVLKAAPEPKSGLDMPAIGSWIQLLPQDVRTTFKAGTAAEAGKIRITDHTFKYLVRGYDAKYPGRIIVNSASAGGNGVGLALYYLNGSRIAGWKKV